MNGTLHGYHYTITWWKKKSQPEYTADVWQLHGANDAKEVYKGGSVEDAKYAIEQYIKERITV